MVPLACRYLLPAAIGLLAVSGCGGAHTTARSPAAPGSQESSGGTVSHSSVALKVSRTTRLPAAVQLPAVAPDGAGAIALGGLNAADASVASMILIDPTGARPAGRLPQALHDAAAVRIDGQVYFFGGGNAGSTSAAILRMGQSGASLVGRLPVGASDVEAATIGHTAYIVGGYTETAPLRSIVSFAPGQEARTVGMLPRPLRYAAVAAVDGRLLIAGGTSGMSAQRAILSFDPATGEVRELGTLPSAVTHAAGASLNGRFYLLGGRGDSLTGQRASILAIDPVSGAARLAGRLPQAMSDLGVASLAGHILLVGGRDSNGNVSDHALTLVPVG
jgi:Kelch motif